MHADPYSVQGTSYRDQRRILVLPQTSYRNSGLSLSLLENQNGARVMGMWKRIQMNWRWSPQHGPWVHPLGVCVQVLPGHLLRHQGASTAGHTGREGPFHLLCPNWTAGSLSPRASLPRASCPAATPWPQPKGAVTGAHRGTHPAAGEEALASDTWPVAPTLPLPGWVTSGESLLLVFQIIEQETFLSCEITRCSKAIRC